jgi:hypothetical protein
MQRFIVEKLNAISARRANFVVQAAGMKVISACLSEKGANDLQAAAAAAANKFVLTMTRNISRLDESLAVRAAELSKRLLWT